MKFQVLSLDGYDVMGGKLNYENTYISCYPEITNEIPFIDEEIEKRTGAIRIVNDPKNLSIGESMPVRYSLSGSKGSYYIKRVE